MRLWKGRWRQANEFAIDNEYEGVFALYTSSRYGDHAETERPLFLPYFHQLYTVCVRETESHKLLCCIIYLCGRLSPSLSFFKRLTFRINERVALVASFTGGKDE